MGVKERPALKADNFTAVSRFYRKCGSLDVSHPYGPPRPAPGIVLPYIRAYQIDHVIKFLNSWHGRHMFRSDQQKCIMTL
jgi:hypothetical protein